MSRLKTDAIRNVNASVDGINLDTSGNVGLGTTSPNTNLHVEGTGTVAEFKSTNNNYLLQLKGNNSANYVYLGTNSSNDYLIANNTNGSGFAERLRITSDGKLGVGDSSPSVSAIFKRDQTTHHYLRVENLNSNSNYTAFSLKTPQLDFQLWNQGPGGSGYGGANSVNFYQGAATGPYCFFHGTAERLRINTNGRVGINRTAPAELLDVYGTIQCSGAGLKIDTHPIVSYASFTDISGGSYAARLGSTGSSTIRSTQIYGGGGHIATFDGVNNRLGINIITPDERLDVRDGDIILSSSNAGNAHRTSFIEFTGSYAKIISEAGLGSQASSNYASGWKFTTRNYTGSAFETRTPLAIHANGDLKISDGNLIIGGAGHGISFINAADTATGETTSSSILDEYEEGTWVPVASRYTGGAISCTYNQQIGNYTKVGRLVTVEFHIQISGSISQGSNLSFLDGLPYVPAASYRASGSVTRNSALTIDHVSTCNVHADFGGCIYFAQATRGTAIANTNWTTGYLNGSITYIASS